MSAVLKSRNFLLQCEFVGRNGLVNRNFLPSCGLNVASSSRFHHPTFAEYQPNYRNDNQPSYDRRGVFALFGLVGVGTAVTWTKRNALRQRISNQLESIRRRSIFTTVSCAEKINDKDEVVRKGYRQTFNFVADVAEKVSPAVVNISIEDERLAHQFMAGNIRVSGGSGFIVREDGLIMTNAHLFMGHAGNIVQVKLMDGRVFHGKLVTMDTELDLAIIKVDGMSNLPVLRFTEIPPRVGEFVLAVGSPLQLRNSITMGVVSNPEQALDEIGLDRPISYVQTDAAVNMGNSGGPLVNLDGEVVAINAMKVAVTDGISFAIPAKHAAKFLAETLQEEQKGVGFFGRLATHKPTTGVRRRKPHFGISYFVVDQQVLSHLRKNDRVFDAITQGVMVHSVTIGSPAHRCGVQPGDVILAVDGQQITDGKLLQAAIAAEKQRKELTIFRRGKHLSLIIDYELE